MRESFRQNEQNVQNVENNSVNYVNPVKENNLSGVFTNEEQGKSLYLIIAGSRCPDSDELIALAESLIPGRYKILLDHPHEKMPELLGLMDVFVLCSLFEMMPIALIEAMSSGLPCIANKHPILEWMIGDGGWTIDMSKDGALAEMVKNMGEDCLAARAPTRASLKVAMQGRLLDAPQTFHARSALRGRPTLRRDMPVHGETPLQASPDKTSCASPAEPGGQTNHEQVVRDCLRGVEAGGPGGKNSFLDEAGFRARRRAEELFSKDVVIPQMLDMYSTVMDVR